MHDYLALIVKEDMYDKDETLDNDSRTELDSHKNMVVVGRNSVILNDTGATASVNPFKPAYEALNVKIVDTVSYKFHTINILHKRYICFW